jgi:uncharacterized DUF497 family protein
VDVAYTLHEIRFEWDRRKAETNLRKHKVPFEAACEVFFDPFIYVEDAGVNQGRATSSGYWDDLELALALCSVC